MKNFLTIAGIAILLLGTSKVWSENEDYAYDSIAKRHASTRLDKRSVDDAKMQGECLVGLKELNFQKSEEFDPVSEWTSLRSYSLLEQFPPCTVLIIIEVARKRLIEIEASK